ncbi:MAG: hypothetical protein HPY61_09350 [Methanotrichaceae archaeon]|nr:hypothetical protein [Methanotrichaceae archaeon]
MSRVQQSKSRDTRDIRGLKGYRKSTSIYLISLVSLISLILFLARKGAKNIHINKKCFLYDTLCFFKGSKGYKGYFKLLIVVLGLASQGIRKGIKLGEMGFLMPFSVCFAISLGLGSWGDLSWLE